MQTVLKGAEPGSRYLYRNLAAFSSRLAWRCHFVQKLEQQPEIEFSCMHSAFEGMREPHFRADFFEAWKTGNTGYPLVDACMRSLHENGWINFRMRAMLVSFASYNLWLDWRKTAPHLARLFTDYEPGIHYSQFQMQSGVTGINTIRMYNPIKQSYEQDELGHFIRRYVPELREVPNSFIHEPWKLLEPLKNYPGPIVDCAASAKWARNEIFERRRQRDFKQEAGRVHQKLGSRSRPSNRKKKSNHVSTKQLVFDLSK
jgi:deoxyribodipyrimidine photo-lyase